MLNFSWFRFIFTFPVIYLPYSALVVATFLLGEKTGTGGIPALIGIGFAWILIDSFQLWLGLLGVTTLSIVMMVAGEVMSIPIFILCALKVWEGYVTPWRGALLYIIWRFDFTGNPVAITWAAIKAYLGLGLYTAILVATPILAGIDAAISNNNIPAIFVGLAISLLFICQRKWILFKRGVLPWPEFDGSEEHFSLLDPNLPPIAPPLRPFGI